MISTVTEFEESTAFERWVLAALVPLTVTRPHTEVKDLEQNVVRVTLGRVGVREYAGGFREVHVDLRPLAFGAAWKVFDLLVEFAQASAHGGAYLKLTAKKQLAMSAAGTCAPLSEDTDLWRTLMAVYANSIEIRNSLVHRKAEVDQQTGALTGRDRDGAPLPSLTADEQEAFCRAVQRAAGAVLAGAITPRERSDLAWQLDQLQQLHGEPLFGGSKLQSPPLVITRAHQDSSRVLLDPGALIAAARENFPDRDQYDADVVLSDGRHLLVELENGPNQEIAIELNSLPSWVKEWDGPAQAE